MVEEKALPVDDIFLDYGEVPEDDWNVLCRILGCDNMDVVRILIPKDSVVIDIPYRGKEK